MSSVPPNLVGPILQTPLAQRQVSALRDAERAQTANAQRQQAAALDTHDTTVETTDHDTQVHTDSEGQGSQGRSFSDADESKRSEEDPQATAQGDEGRLLDLQA
jgi:hypothetical protein